MYESTKSVFTVISGQTSFIIFTVCVISRTYLHFRFALRNVKLIGSFHDNPENGSCVMRSSGNLAVWWTVVMETFSVGFHFVPDFFSPFKGPMTAVTEALDSDWEIDRRFARRIDDKQPSVASLVRKSCARVCSARACAPFCPGPAAARAQDEWLTDGTAERADAHRESSRCSVCVLWGFASDTLWERDSWGTRLGITADSPGGFSLLSSERNARDTVSDDG